MGVSPEGSAPEDGHRAGEVTLTGHIEAPAARLEAVRAALPEHIRLTLAEPGCLEFEVRESAERPGRFEVRERFADATAFHAHQARVRGSGWGRVSTGLRRSYSIKGLDR